MSDFNARHIIEALRSGVPSRAAGEYFSEARPGMLRRISAKLEDVRESGRPDGMIYTGRYGEGKTHLLNTIWSMAFSDNMVVSFVSLGKETPIDKPWILYQKLMANTYLPGAGQPGFRQKLEELTPGSSITGELLAYASRELKTDKLYYLLKAFLGTQEEEERYAFLADLEGDYTTSAAIRKSCRRITGVPVKFAKNFSKTKHAWDYFYFISHLFRTLGYQGWVILFDEAELIGRFGKKTRLKSYMQMQAFLKPSPRLEGVFSLFAMSSSYTEDVIDRKREFENTEAVYTEDPESAAKCRDTLQTILNAPELMPLTREEIGQILMSIQKFHGRAYGWEPQVSADTLYKATAQGGYLLRTKIRAAIEFFDQLYQYGEACSVKITELGRERFEEEDVPELPEF